MLIFFGLREPEDQFSAKFLLTIGGTVLSAGIFTGIVKSAQFTELFQNHIFQVLHDPEKVISQINVITKWQILTRSILKSTLPVKFNDAADVIMSLFIVDKSNDQESGDSRLDYHFEDYHIRYDIHVEENTARITVENTARLVVSPSVKNPILKQKISTKGSIESPVIRLNGKTIECETDDEQQTINFNVKLDSYFDSPNDQDDRLVDFEKTLTVVQNIDKEPHISAISSRYMKGCTVKARINKGYELVFESFGYPFDQQSPEPVIDENTGFTKWPLAGLNDLLLPGQGYILIIIPESRSTKL